MLRIHFAAALIVEIKSRRWSRAKKGGGQRIWEEGVIGWAQIIDGRVFVRQLLLRAMLLVDVIRRHFIAEVVRLWRIAWRLLFLLMTRKRRIFSSACQILLIHYIKKIHHHALYCIWN